METPSLKSENNFFLEYHDNKIELIMNEIKQKAENELLNIAQSDIVMNNQHILFLDDEQKDMITRITINEEALDRLQKQLPKGYLFIYLVINKKILNE